MTARGPFWKWHLWKSIGCYPYIYLCHLSLELIFKAKLKLESGNKKIQYGRLAAKINRLLHRYAVLCHLSFKVIFMAKLQLESRNQKIQYGHQAAILKVTSLKINRLLPMTTINMLTKFEIEIPKQTWLMLRKPCRLQTDGRRDGWTDKVNPVYPPSNFVGQGYNKYYPGFLSWSQINTTHLKTLRHHHLLRYYWSNLSWIICTW